MIQIKDDTQKGAGDRITVGLRMQLTGDGIQGDGTLEGNEEALTTYSDNVFIDQLRHAVRSAGKMSEQRVPFSVREEARLGLQDWWSDRFDAAAINQLTGNTGESDTRRTGNQATIAATAARLICGGSHSLESSLSATTTDSLQLSDIDRLVTRAKTLTPLIRPIKVGGVDKFVLMIHPNQMNSLRTNNTATVGNYVDIFKAAMNGGKFADNPIMTGALC